MGLDIPLCFRDLQHLDHDGVVPPNLSSFGKKKTCMYGHTSACLNSFISQLQLIAVEFQSAKSGILKLFQYPN